MTSAARPTTRRRICISCLNLHPYILYLFFFCMYKISGDKACATAGPPPPHKCGWGPASPNVKCNQGAGEVPLKASSTMASSLEQCKKSCEDTVGCRSVTYFKTGWCAHFSTPCTKTKKNGKAIVERLACKPVPTPCTTHPAPPTSEFA